MTTPTPSPEPADVLARAAAAAHAVIEAWETCGHGSEPVECEEVAAAVLATKGAGQEPDGYAGITNYPTPGDNERRGAKRAGQAADDDDERHNVVCRVCGDAEPVHVHNGDERIEDYFTVGRGETDFMAAQRWKARWAAATDRLATLGFVAAHPAPPAPSPAIDLLTKALERIAGNPALTADGMRDIARAALEDPK